MAALSAISKESAAAALEFKQKEEADEAPPTLNFQGPSSCFTRTIYWLTRPAMLLGLYPLHYPSLLRLPFVALAQTPAQSHELMRDIGGERIFITTQAGTRLSAFYFDPREFQSKQEAAFKKWKARFDEPAYAKLAEVLEINREGTTLQHLLRLPDEVKPLKTDVRGVVIAQGAGQTFAFDPQGALMFLLRGMHAVLFDYSGIMQSSGSPGWGATCHDMRDACLWLKQRLSCENQHLIALGKSMGSGPAVWTGTQLPGIHVVIDRGIANLPHVIKQNYRCLSPLGCYVADKFYRYPNTDLLPYVKGEVLIMQAVEDELIDASNADMLFQALVISKLPTESDDRAREVFKQKHWIKAAGSHSSIAGGDKTYSWYCHGQTQVSLSAFIRSLSAK